MTGSAKTDLAHRALNELGAVFTALSSEATTTLVEETLRAKRIALYGVGREGLMMRAFAMRLFHLGLDVHVVGDMTTPPLGTGDLLMVSAGPGSFSTVLALLDTAGEAGARRLVVTAQPGGDAAGRAEAVVHLPAQTMADDRPGENAAGDGAASVLPMGSLFEATQLLFFEVVVLLLKERLGQNAEAMRRRHTNLE